MTMTSVRHVLNLVPQHLDMPLTILCSASSHVQTMVGINGNESFQTSLFSWKFHVNWSPYVFIAKLLLSAFFSSSVFVLLEVARETKSSLLIVH